MAVMDKCDVSHLEDLLLFENGDLRVVPASVLEESPQNEISVFCWKHGLYGLLTIELIEWLDLKIGGRKAIEIGAGNGALGRELGIRTTDSFQQEKPEFKALYASTGQPTVKYGSDVERIDAIRAMRKYSPQVVIGNWVTHKYRKDAHEKGGNAWGIDEDKILERVEEYIVIGNQQTHGKKHIIDKPHEKFAFPWLYSRSMHYQDNCIYVWKGARHEG
jgi:hypothetical protein